MRDDAPSSTAEYVAMGRARAQLEGGVRGFSDPFALKLLPPELQAAAVARGWPRSRRQAFLRAIAFTTSRMMGPRTVAIDEALGGMPRGFQLVILGAGLDARAHRLDSLKDSVVFEVDHPASQAAKRDRAAGLPVVARELRYVPIDFTRDALGAVLDRAGHDPSRPTAWIWEGIVTYLSRSDIEASLDVMRGRSATSSRLVMTYNEPSLARRLASAISARAGEPHRTWLESTQLRALLTAHGFTVQTDLDGVERAHRCGVSPGVVEHAWVRAHHVVVAIAGGE